MDNNLNDYERIGPWTEVKHQIIREYSKSYSIVLSNQPHLSHVYIDAFAGAGRYVSKRTNEVVPGSPEIALTTEPPFTEYHFIDIDDLKLERLETIAGQRLDVFIHRGDCNDLLISAVLPRIKYADYKRGLCILDPYGLHLNWGTVAAIGKTKSTEVFLNFPIMDINRNVLHSNRATVLPSQELRMTKFWGDESWKDIAFRPKEQLSYWGERGEEKAINNIMFANAYRDRLLNIAGFSFVPDPLPMRHKGATLYYLFFASQNETGKKIVSSIFNKFR